jgi:hypothetical protein
VTFLLDENLTPPVKTVSSSRTEALNKIQWFILVIFKYHILKDGMHELGDSRHTLHLYCRRYIRITSDDILVLLNKSQWEYLMELDSSCVDSQIMELFKLYDELIQRRNKCLETQSFSTPPNTSAFDFETLYDEIMYKTVH